MEMIRRLMPSCREVATSLSTGQFEETPLLRQLMLRLHLMMCALCRSYSEQLALLGRGLRERAKAARLAPDRMKGVKQRLIQRLAHG